MAMDEQTLANRKYLLDGFVDEYRAARQAITDWASTETDVTSRVVTLAVAIVGVVVPILTTRPNLASMTWLVRSTLASIVVISIGVVRIWFIRYLAMLSYTNTGSNYRAMVAAIANNMEDLPKANEQIQAVAAGWPTRVDEKRLALMFLFDCTFYGVVLLSLLFLAVAFVKR